MRIAYMVIVGIMIIALMIVYIAVISPRTCIEMRALVVHKCTIRSVAFLFHPRTRAQSPTSSPAACQIVYRRPVAEGMVSAVAKEAAPLH